MKKVLTSIFALLSFCGISAGGIMPSVEIPHDSPYQAEADRVYVAIENQARYLLSLVRSWKGDDRYKLTTASKGGEEHITRPNTCAVATFAFLYKHGDYSEDIVGIGREELLNDNIIPMLRYLLALHKTGPADKTFDNGAKWGLSWQSAVWTWQLAQAFWMLWDVLPPDMCDGARVLITAEADRVAARTPPFRLTVDSKSEENAWDSMVLSAALLLMPDSPKYSYWENAMTKWQVSAYSRPADKDNENRVDGYSVKDLFSGANIHNDYTLENHGIAHPDYMSASTLVLKTGIDYVMTGRQPRESTLFNLDKIYEQLKFMLLPGGQYGYPSGQDWAIFRGIDFIFLHAAHLLFFQDPDALHWVRECITTLESMQARSDKGAAYAPNENFFPSAQAHLGVYMMETWRALMFARPVSGKFTNPYGTKILPDGKIYIRRTDKSMHTVSWGRKIMIQSFRYADDPMVGPAWHNGVGYIKTAGNNADLPLRLQEIDIQEEKTSESVLKLVVMHGEDIRADIVVRSCKNGKMSITEKLTAVRDVVTNEIATLYIGILNHPGWIYEIGYREVTAGKMKKTVKSMSGDILTLTGKKVSIDGTMVIKSDKTIGGSYAGASKWQASKLMDRMILNHIQGTHRWKQNDVISEQTIEIAYK